MYYKHLTDNNLKRYHLVLILLVLAFSANGQSNFYRISLGASAGSIYSFTDVKKGAFTYAFAGNLDYHITPFITGGVEVQAGTIKGGGEGGAPDIHGRQFTNTFKAFTVNGKFRAGEFTDFYYSDFLNYTKGFYLGVGIGAIQNDLTAPGGVVRDKPQIGAPNDIYTFPGVSKSTNMLLPINLGIDFYFPDGWGDIRYIFNVNYQTNFTFGEGLDGYNDPKSKFRNLAPDMYNFLSIGAKYTFGPKGLTGKSIR